jgi:hypothetical protein
MKRFLKNRLGVPLLMCVFALCVSAEAQDGGLDRLITTHDYVQKRVSSYDKTGGNGDAVSVAPGTTFTVLDEPGPGLITHVWFTIASPERSHLKKLVLRMYWDGEATPSVEAPIGDFFGLGMGDYFTYQSIPLSVAPDKALNSFFEMPFQKSARITVTNEGEEAVDALYFNVDYRALPHPLPAGTFMPSIARPLPPGDGRTSGRTMAPPM